MHDVGSYHGMASGCNPAVIHNYIFINLTYLYFFDLIYYHSEYILFIFS